MTEGTITLPKRITLGNILSMAVSVGGVFVVIVSTWTLYGSRLAQLEKDTDAFTLTYARQADLDRLQREADGIVEDRKVASKEVRDRLTQLTAAQGDGNIKIAALIATLQAVQIDIADIKVSLARRADLSPTSRLDDAFNGPPTH